MSCNDDKTYEPCSCGCGGSSDCNCDCSECAPVNCIEQAIRDALATLQEQLEALVKRAEDAAKTSEDAAAASAASADEAKGYRDAAELAATTATDALKTITDVAVSLEETAKKLQEIADELATAIAGIAVVTWYYTAVSEGQTVIPVPADKNALDVQCIYIEGARQEPGRGFVFDKTAMTITLAEGIPLGLEISIILGTYSDNPTDFPQTLASNNGASLVGTASGQTVQQELNTLKQASDPILSRLAAESGLPMVGTFEAGATVSTASQSVGYKAEGKLYTWAGALPKTVEAGATPATAGGIAANAWVRVDQQTLRDQLSAPTGANLVGYQSILAGAVKRTQASVNMDTINIKDFGAIGDGSDHPLSEIFTSLALAQVVYPFVTSLTQTQDYAGIQSAINAAKLRNAAVFAPSGSYVTKSTIIADYALTFYGEGAQGLRDTNPAGHQVSPVRGTVIHSKVATGRTFSVDATANGGGYSFGLSLRHFAIWGVENQCDVGLYVHSIGWMGVIESVNIQFFPNQALEIGYIQDTYIKNCSFVHCGSKDKPAVTCLVESNYVYFIECHFELTPYFIKFDKCWNFSFTKCHFEVARPVTGTVDDRFVYQSAAIDFGSSYRFQFTDNTFIPVDVGYLSTKLGVARDAVPYFMTGAGTYFSFKGDIFLAPEGSVNAGYFTGSHTHFSDVQFIGMSPSKECLHITIGKVNNCTFGISAHEDLTKLYGCYVGEGIFSGNLFGFSNSDAGGKRSAGALVYGSAQASDNYYPDDDRIFIYVDATMTVNGMDGQKPRFKSITATQNVDLTRLHPATHLAIDGDNVQIPNVYGAPFGRELLITSNKTGAVIKYSADSLITKAGVDYPMSQYTTVSFRCINTGKNTLWQIS